MRLTSSFGRLLAATVLAAAAAVVGGAGASGAVDADATTILTTQVIPGLDQLTYVRPHDPRAKVEVGVALTHPHEVQEAALQRALYTEGDPMFHRFLTPGGYAAAFGIDVATRQRVHDAVTAQGLTVAYASNDGSYVLLNGTAQAVEDTFAVHLDDYRAKDGSAFYANTEAPTVPAGVEAVLGLTDADRMHLAQDICLPGNCTGTLTHTDLWSAYDQPGNNFGTGVGVGIFGEGVIDPPINDLRIYEATRKGADNTTAAPLRQVPVRRVLVNDDLTSSDGTGEWDLDEAAIDGMAPDIESLSYYFGSSLATSSIAGTYSAWVNDSAGPAIGNSSFGGCENLQAVTGAVTVFDQQLRAATMIGRTMFVSTGDVGGSCGVGPAGVNGVSNGGQPQAEYPASSPFVVAVGGSVLYTATTGPTTRVQALPATRASEIAWTHTGGASSFVEPKPAYQTGIFAINGVCTTTPETAPAPPGQACRGVPDVEALSGDVITNGYAIVSAGAQSESGGTSLSSPLWAGMWARVVASHPATCAAPGGTTAGPIGFANPALYAVGKNATQDPTAFFDVTEGDNGQNAATPRNAVNPTGWDYVSGLGVPDVTVLMKDVNCTTTAPVKANATLPPDATISPTMVCPPTGTITDPPGDATATGAEGLPAAGANTPSLDILSGKITSDANALTYSLTMANLTADTNRKGFEMKFSFRGADYDLFVDSGMSSAAPTYQLIQYDPATMSATTNVLATVTGSYNMPASTVSIVLPYSAFNMAGRSGLGPSATIVNLTASADLNPNGKAESAPAYDTVDFLCPYTIAGPATTTLPAPPTVPESPFVPLLAATAGLAGATVIVFRRRKA